MPKLGRDRRSARDDARGTDSVGGLGTDEDYDWIKYLGEGRTSSAAPGAGQPAVQPVAGRAPQSSARPATLPIRPREGDDTPRGPLPDRTDGGAGRAARSTRPGPGPTEYDTGPTTLPPSGSGGRRAARGPTRYEGAGRPPPPGGYDAGPATLPPAGYGVGRTPPPPAGSDGSRSLPPPSAGSDDGPAAGRSDRYWRPARRSRPIAGPAVRLTAGQPVDLASGRETDLSFNPAAEEYGQPLYAQPGPRPSRRRARPDRPKPQRPDLHRPEQYPPVDRLDARMDTSEYASPLYRSLDAGPVAPTRPRRPEPVSDPLTGTDARRAAPAGRGSVRRPDRTGPLPRRLGSARTGPQPRTDGPDGFGGPDTGRVVRAAGLAAVAEPSTATKARVRAGVGKAKTRTGRRLSRKILAFGAAAVVVVLVAAGLVLFWPQPPHVISAPATLGGYTRQRENPAADALKRKIVTAAPGDVKNVVAAGYVRKTGPGTRHGPVVVVFIGGNLTGGASASSLISAYVTELRGAFTTSPGKLGGQAACAPGAPGRPAECAWADNDTFGVVVSATLSSTALANEMRLMRPQLEHLAR